MLRTALALLTAAVAALTPATASAKLASNPAGDVTIEWPGRTCELDDLALDADPDFEYAPPTAEDVAAASDTPVLDIPGEPVADAGADESETWPLFDLQPWRIRYHADGGYELWHDDRCAGYADIRINALDVGTVVLQRAKHESASAHRHHRSSARRRALK